MKLKYLLKLNALLILCSMALETMSKFSLTLETSFDMMKPYSIKRVENQAIKNEDINKEKFNTYHKCDVKSGVVNQIVSKDEKKREMIIQPIYYQLNTVSLNFYDTMGNSAQLLAIMPIEKVTRLLQIYSGTHCITFILKTETGREKEGLTVCPDSEKDKDDWIRVVTDFKECDINVHQSERNEEVILDFTKVNYLLSEKNKTESLSPSELKILQEKKDEEIINGMWYDNSQKTDRKPPGSLVRTSAMKKEMTNIISALKNSNLAQQKLQREYQGKIAQAEKIKKDVEKQQEIVRTILQKRALKEKERKAAILRKATQNKELKLMKAVRMQIEKIKKKEMEQTKKALKKQLNFIKGVPEEPKTSKAKQKQNEMAQALSELRIPLDSYDAGVFAGELPSSIGGPLAKALIAKYGPLGENKLVKLARVPGMEKKYRQLNKAASKKNKIASIKAKSKLGKNGKVSKKKLGKVPAGKKKIIRGPKGKIIQLTTKTIESSSRLFDYSGCTDPRLTGKFEYKHIVFSNGVGMIFFFYPWTIYILIF